MADRRPIGRIHPTGVPAQQHPLTSFWTALPPELTAFAKDVAQALSSNASTPDKVKRILAAVPSSDILSCILRLLHRRFLPFIAAYSSPWGFTMGLGAGLIMSNWENPNLCSIRRLKENYNIWLSQGADTTRKQSYLKYIIFKLARYSIAPLLLYSLPRHFTHVHYSEKALVAPRLVSAAVAVGFGLQSASDLVTELRASSDPLLYILFQQLEVNVDPRKAKAWIRSSVNAFTAYGVLGSLRLYSIRGMYAVLPQRMSTPQVTELKANLSRLDWAYLVMGVLSVYRAYLYT